MEDKKTKVVNFLVDDNLYGEIQLVTGRYGMTVAGFMRLAIRNQLHRCREAGDILNADPKIEHRKE